MPHYTILSTDNSYVSAELIAANAAEVLNLVHRLDCTEADIWRDGTYCFSLRAVNGLWCAFSRGEPLAATIQSFG